MAFCPRVAWAQGAYKRLKYKAKTKNLKNIKKGLAFFCKGAHIGFASRAKGLAGRGRQGAARQAGPSPPGGRKGGQASGQHDRKGKATHMAINILSALKAAGICLGIALAWALAVGFGMLIAGIFCAAGASASFHTACYALAVWGIISGIGALAGMGIAIYAQFSA